MKKIFYLVLIFSTYSCIKDERELVSVQKQEDVLSNTAIDSILDHLEEVPYHSLDSYYLTYLSSK